MNTVKSRFSYKWISLLPLSVFLVLIIGGCNYILPNKPPYVRKVNPADSAVFTIGEVVNFKVDAYDVDGKIIQVVFKAPNTTGYSDTVAPYEFLWPTATLVSGDYHVEIKAIDDQGEPYIIQAPVRVVDILTTSAGRDTTFTDSRTSYVLQAVLQPFSTGTWSILSGTGGAISDIHNKNATLTGLPCQAYTLRWSINNGAVQVSSDVIIRFNYQPSKANAGTDQWIFNGTTTAILNAETPKDGNGLWEILSGGSGVFSNSSSPTTSFTGQLCIDYKLIWRVSTPCAFTADTVDIKFKPYLTPANAGPDQSFTDGRKTTTLAANPTGLGTGLWTVTSGSGGVFGNTSDPKSGFIGQPCETYILRWTISTLCESSSDEMTLSFNDLPSTPNAGPDLYITDGTIFAQLNATPPVNGTGLWTILSGGGGSLSDPSKPNTMFYGQQCHTYTLRWTVSTPCISAFDEVNVVLNQVEIKADAGQDRRISDGQLSVNLQGNSPGTNTTGSWSIISGTNGFIENSANPGSLFTGINGQIYTLKWTLSGACLENSDMVVISFISGVVLEDSRDRKTYRAIKLGDQYWMSENLNFSMQGSNAYDYSANSASIYGRLYDWNTAQSACPAGWHLPSDNEWRQLEVFLGMDANTSLMEWYRGGAEGGMLKEQGNQYWTAPNAGATNISGFTARPGGYRAPGGQFGGINTHAGFWSSTGNTEGKAIYRALHTDKSQAGRDWYDKGYGFSIRCVKN